MKAFDARGWSNIDEVIMAGRLTEHEIVEIAKRFEYPIERVRVGADETEWIERLLRDNPTFDVVDAIRRIISLKWINGDFDQADHYAFEKNRNNHLTDRLLRTFAEETGLNLARLKAVAAQGDRIDQLMKDENIDYVNALLKLY